MISQMVYTIILWAIFCAIEQAGMCFRQVPVVLIFLGNCNYINERLMVIIGLCSSTAHRIEGLPNWLPFFMKEMTLMMSYWHPARKPRMS